jgi:hypothetical protein
MTVNVCIWIVRRRGHVAVGGKKVSIPQQTKIKRFLPLLCSVRHTGRADSRIRAGESGSSTRRERFFSNNVTCSHPQSIGGQRRVDDRKTEGSSMLIGGWHRPAFHVRRALPQLRVEMGSDDDVLRLLEVDLAQTPATGVWASEGYAWPAAGGPSSPLRTHLAASRLARPTAQHPPPLRTLQQQHPLPPIATTTASVIRYHQNHPFGPHK